MSLVVAAIILVVVGITIAIGAEITTEVGSDQLVTSSSTTYNQTLSAATTSVNQSVTFEVGQQQDTAAAVIVYNSTDGVVIENGDGNNYTLYPDGVFSMVNSNYDDSIFNITFTYNQQTRSASYNASYEATEGIGKLGNWQTTISTVVAAVIIIGLLLAGFGIFLLAKNRF